jgi:hypothetical protein
MFFGNDYAETNFDNRFFTGYSQGQALALP